MSFKNWLNLTIAMAAIVVVAASTLFIVPVHQYAIVTQFGKSRTPSQNGTEGEDSVCPGGDIHRQSAP